MAKDNDINSGGESIEDTEGLSATAMFLRSLEAGDPTAGKNAGSKFGRAQQRLEQPAVPSRTSVPGAEKAPGEFTQLFGTEARSQSPEAPITTNVSRSGPNPNPSPGEFTRIFVGGESSAPERPAVSQAPTTPTKGRPSGNTIRHKGFSTPGVSDSASAAGSFTRGFSSAPAAPNLNPSPLPPARPLGTFGQQASMQPGSVPEVPAPRVPGPAPANFSVTDMFASRAQTAGDATFQPPAQPGYTTTPHPAFSDPGSNNPASGPPAGAGSVTSLIERITHVAVAAPVNVVRDDAAAVAKPVLMAPLPPAEAPPSGPGEYTRIMGLSTAPAAAGTKTVPAASAPATTPPPAEAASPAAKPAPPAAKPPDPPAAPAAEKSTLESLVPILLVVNTFLLLLILLVTFFGLKNR